MANEFITGVTGGSAVLFGELREGQQQAAANPVLLSVPVLAGVLRASRASVQGEVVVTPVLEGSVLDSFPFLNAVVAEIEGAFEYFWTSHDPIFVEADLEAEASFLRLGNSANDGTPASVFGRAIGVAELTGDLTINLRAADDPVLEANPELFQTYNFRDGDTLLDAPALLFPDSTPDEPLVQVFAVRSPPFVLFDGTNFLERSASDAALNPGAAAFSLSVTFDPELTQAGSTCTVVSKNNATNTQAGWKLTWNATTGLATFTFWSDAAGSNSRTRSTSSQVRVRSRVTVTVSAAGAINIYKDGALDQGAETGTETSVNASTEPLAIGCDEPSNNGTERMLGAVYDFAFWDTELSGVDAQTLLPVGSIPTAIDTINLVVYFDGQDLLANQLSGFYASWADAKSSLLLTPGNPPSSVQIPAYAADSSTAQDTPPCLSVQFHNGTSLIDQSDVDPDPTLQTTHRLDSTAQWRIWSPGSLTPQIPGVFRSYRNDLTITILLSKVSGANFFTLLRFYGIFFEFQSVGGTRIIDGDDNVGTNNASSTFRRSVSLTVASSRAGRRSRAHHAVS